MVSVLWTAPFFHHGALVLGMVVPALVEVWWMLSLGLQVYFRRKRSQEKQKSRRLAYHKIASDFDFSEVEVNQLIEIFWRLDLNQDDKVDALELSKALGSSFQAAEKYISEIDFDLSNDMDFEEFLELAQKIRDSSNPGAFGRVLAQSKVFDFLFQASLRVSSSSSMLSEEEDLGSSMGAEVVMWCLKCNVERACIEMVPCGHLTLCEQCDNKEAGTTTKKISKHRKCALCSQKAESARQVYF
jgi:hypothetical protein